MTETNIVEAYVVVSGHVQGVSFRAHTTEVAAKAGICGWVRNLPERQVEAVLQGGRDAVEKVIDFMRTGPPMAHVTDISVLWRTPAETCRGFNTRY
ncbi:MAG: acylphosphatase [Syntrophorhabdaceae bacterium]|nr:acylphosphatase [Syntrophorhabdaceae bacterium]